MGYYLKIGRESTAEKVDYPKGNFPKVCKPTKCFLHRTEIDGEVRLTS